MTSFSRIISIFFIILLPFTLDSCDSNDKVVEPSKKMLVMGTSADYPPFEFIKDKQIKGFDVDLAEIIAEKLGYSLYIRDISFSGLIPAIQTQRIDFAMASFTRTPERERVVDFSTVYYTPSYAMIYKKNKPINGIKDIEGRSVGVQLGTTLEGYLNTLFKDDNFKIISLTRTLPMIQDLKLGRLDAVLVEEAQAKVFLSKNDDLDYYLFTNDEYGYSIVFAQGSKLKEQFDEVIIQLRDSGELAELKKKWLF